MVDSGHLRLNADLVNHHFSNWRLSQEIVQHVDCNDLPGHVYVAEADALDFVHTRVSVLHNHLYRGSKGTLYFFSRGESLMLHHLTVGSHFQVRENSVATPINSSWDNRPPRLDTPLNPSVVEVVQASASPGQSCDQPCDGPCDLLVVSTGEGDVQLISRDGSGAAPATALFPLRPPAPLIGCRSLHLEAAYLVSPGEIRAVLWGVVPKTNSLPGHLDAYVLTFTFDIQTGNFAVAGLQPLLLLEHPFHAVVVDPAGDGVVVAASEAPTSRPVPPQWGEGMGGNEEEDAVSPRTLRQAAEQLAKYTSAEEGGGPSDQWTDFFSHRSGADATTAREPDCVIYSFSCRPPPPSPATPSQEGGSPDRGAPPSLGVEEARHVPSRALLPSSQISCLPHKLVARGWRNDSPLLGVADDVDCAVLSLALLDGRPTRPAVQHLASVPALAYVAAGKVQRKAVLLGSPGARVSAAIVESHKYAYLYRRVPPGEQYGEHQVVDMGLADKEIVLGAALVENPSNTSHLVLLSNTKIIAMTLT